MSAEKGLGSRNVDLPEGWREAPLGSVADVRFSSVDKLAYPSEEPVRLCNYMDVYKNDYITADLPFMHASATQPEIDRFGLRVGDVIVTKDSETPYDIGRPAVVDYAAPDLVCGYHLALIRPDRREIDPTFLAKQLGHDRIARFFAGRANGLTRYGLPIDAVMAAPLWLPLRTEQEAAGALFRLLDQAIAQADTVIAKLEQIRTGLFRDLLTRGMDENGELRDPILHPEKFRDSHLGRIPIDWQLLTLEECCHWFSGGTPERSRASWWAGPIPFLTPKDIKSFELSDTSEHITQEALQSGSRLMPEDTVFIVVRGMILAHTFPVCLSSVPFAFNQDIKAIRGRGKLKNRFLALWFAANADLFLRRATEATHGTKKLDTAELYRARIGVPSPEEQEAITTHIEAVAQEEAAEIATHDKLLRLKSGLMSDLLTGRVRVPADLVEVPE